ncbi:MAG: Phospho-N-acetylmuramoyl-pentapeptide-transferase [bacterium]|nr:Phospho-N-acetylmuramoyl-pentapeptide-transferase [bacterium]
MILLAAAIVTWLTDGWLLQWLTRQQVRAQIRTDGPATHQAKAKTPALGGAVFPLGWLAGLLVGVGFLLAEDRTYFSATPHRITLALLLLVNTAAFGIGFADDWLKVAQKSSTGLKARFRLPLQLLAGLLLGWVASMLAGDAVRHFLPIPGLQWALLPSMALVGWLTLYFAGTLNAVNFTDGLDTLLAGTGTIALLIVGILSYGWVARWVPMDPLLGHAAFAGAGVLLGFYPHNRHPAKLFMGDGGAYFIGGLLASITALQGTSFCFLVIGAVFYLELLSVILQVSVFRLTKGQRRLFPMAPLHHALEVKGWKEQDVVSLFWGISLGAGLLGWWIVRTL